MYDTCWFVLIDLGKAVLTSSLLAPSDAVEKGSGLFKVRTRLPNVRQRLASFLLFFGLPLSDLWAEQGREEGATAEDPERQPLLDT